MSKPNSGGVGFTVFQVPGSKAAKKASAGGPRLGNGGPAAVSGPTITTSIIHSVTEPFQPQGAPTAPFSASIGSSSSVSSTSSAGAAGLGLGRGQRNSTSGFTAFQPATSGHQHQVPTFQSTTSTPQSFTAFGAGLGSGGGVASTPGSQHSIGGPSLSSTSASSTGEARGGIGWMRTGRVIRVKDTGESYRFPLDEEHLPRVRATAAQFAALKDKLERVADKYVGNAATWMENPTLSSAYRNQSWKVQVEKRNGVVYRQKTSDTRDVISRKAIVRAKLDTTLEEIEYALYSDTTEELRAYLAHCYQESFLDAAVLQVHERGTAADPLNFVGLKWLVFQSSVDSVFSCRDSLVVEMSKTYEDAKGQKVLVRVTQSVDPRELECQEKNFGFNRTGMTTVYLFRSMGPSSGKVDAAIFADMQFEGGKTTPSWLANRVISTLYHVVVNHATCADAKFLVKARLITDKAWVPNNERPACSVCFKSFNLLRSRHHCRVCAEIMCSPCTLELGIQASKLPVGMLPEQSSGCIVSVEKFCLKCINKARQERRSAIARAADYSSSVDEEGNPTVPASFAGRASEVFYQNQNDGSRGSLSDMPGFYDSLPANSNHQSQSFASVSSSSSTGSVSGAPTANSEKSAISYAGWSTKVLSAINREKPSDGSDASITSLTGSTNSLNISGTMRNRAGERRRQNSDASQTTSVSSQSERGSNSLSDLRGHNLNGTTDSITVVEEDIVDVTPLPTSFTKMEEQIAAQQALLRSMFVEGQKMMQQRQGMQPQYINQIPQQQYIADGAAVPVGPAEVVVMDETAPAQLTVPPPAAVTSIESID